MVTIYSIDRLADRISDLLTDRLFPLILEIEIILTLRYICTHETSSFSVFLSMPILGIHYPT